MSKLIRAFYVMLLLGGSAARADELPPDIRWPTNSMTFFFVNSGGDTTVFYHAFVRATQRWQPGNFFISMTSNAAGNTPCRDRSPGVPVVNIAQFVGSVPTICGDNAQFTPRTLAVTVVGRNDDKSIKRADMFFTTSRIWGIYDGPLYQPPYGGRPDFQRVAVHELGHAAGLPHALTDRSSIMYPEISDVDRPSGDDTARLRVKYATPLPPSPSPTPTPPPGDFACPSHIPFAPVVDLGTLSSSTYRLGECLDATRPETVFYFEVASQRQMRIGLGADKAELNVSLLSGTSQIWSAINTGELKKATTRTFAPGRYSLRVWPQVKGSTYSLALEFQ
jgi:Matrixin